MCHYFIGNNGTLTSMEFKKFEILQKQDKRFSLKSKCPK